MDDITVTYRNYVKNLMKDRARRWDVSEEEARNRTAHKWMENREIARQGGDEVTYNRLNNLLKYLD